MWKAGLVLVSNAGTKSENRGEKIKITESVKNLIAILKPFVVSYYGLSS